MALVGAGSAEAGCGYGGGYTTHYASYHAPVVHAPYYAPPVHYNYYAPAPYVAPVYNYAPSYHYAPTWYAPGCHHPW